MFSNHRQCILCLQKIPQRLRKCAIRSVSGGYSISEIRTSEPGTISATEERRKPYTNLPFIKGLFLGDYDKTFLSFPEVIRTEELHILREKIKPVKQLFNEDVDSRSIDQTGHIPENILSHIKELGLFGMQVETLKGGMGLDSKGCAHMNEIIGVDGSISATVSAHQELALQTIIMYGSEEQREKYVGDIAQGKRIAAYCVAEAGCGSDVASIKTTAIVSNDNQTYTINGTKTWVTNGTIADVFVVFVKTNMEFLGEEEQLVSAFIVDRSVGGITCGEPVDKMGLNAAQICDVTFENTVVSADNLIADIGKGYEMTLAVMSSARLAEGAAVTGALKHVMGLAAEHVIARKQFQKPLAEFGLVKEKFAEMSVMMYVLESMTYLTAGINDQYEKPETSLESAIVKVYATDVSWSCLRMCMQLFGAAGCLADNHVQRHVRDAFTNAAFKGTNDMLRLYIALLGLQHSALKISEEVRKRRNPLTNVGWKFKEIAKSLRNNFESPKPIFKLYDHVHPNLSFAAEEMEKRVHQFRHVVVHTANLYGPDILHEQDALSKLANIAIEIYAMTAVLARSSRSKSIGLRNADHEILMAQYFTEHSSLRIENALNKLRIGKYENGDLRRQQLADQIFKSRGYAAEHPLERNW